MVKKSHTQPTKYPEGIYISYPTFAKFSYFLFFAMLSSAVTGFGYLPFFLVDLISNFSTQSTQILTYFFPFLFLILPILFLLIPVILLPRLTKQLHRFLFIFLFLTFAYIFSYPHLFSMEQARILLTIFPLLILWFSWLLTRLWKILFVKKLYKYSFLLWLAFVVDAIIIMADPSLMQGYITLGEFLNKISGHTFNIFFLDYSGFAVLFINTINALIVFIVLYIIQKQNYGEK